MRSSTLTPRRDTIAQTARATPGVSGRLTERTVHPDNDGTNSSTPITSLPQFPEDQTATDCDGAVAGFPYMSGWRRPETVTMSESPLPAPAADE